MIDLAQIDSRVPLVARVSKVTGCVVVDGGAVAIVRTVTDRDV